MKKVTRWWDHLPVAGIVLIVAFFVGFGGWLTNEPFVGNNCLHPLRHVYHPQRLVVIAACQKIDFKVVSWRKEHDGDVHVDGTVAAGGWTDPANVRGQHGLTVVEFTPWDPKPKSFFVGQELNLTVTKVYDQQHKHKDEANGWIEGHPVFSVEDVTPDSTIKSPNEPALVTSEDDP